MKQKSSTISAFWGVLWRSALLLPVSVLFLVVLCAAFVLWIALPIMALLCAWSSDWWHAVAFAAAWVPVFAFLRWWWRRERSDKNWGVL